MRKDKWMVEVTDTFGGEANYSWVHKYPILVPIGKCPIRAAKKAAGWTGLRCDTDSIGDFFEVRPRHICMVMFIQSME